MAGNKMNTKTKGKEEKGKTGGKVIDQNNEETEDPDFSLLRKPIFTSVTGFEQARKIFDLATEELKTLLSNECDILYECKVCRNIFRSLANFISHKRVYCKEKFNSKVHGHFIKSTSTLNELLKIKRTERDYQESLLENMDTDDVDERVPLSKDLTEIIEKISKKKKLLNKNSEERTVVTEKIPSSSVAVFQTVESKGDKYNNMRLQVKELQQILSQDTAVLQNDGKFKIQNISSQESMDNVIQISDDEDNDSSDLKCKTCDMQFSTLKTLKFHMKYKHVESRLVYPCPDCLDIFSTSWSVYRHLFKVHRKTAAQIRRLRESIQSKAFKMNNPPAFYERRRNNIKTATTQKISEEERLDQENQAWMDNMEGDGEVPRCGGCGRTFERRAALAAHTHTCAPRTRALAAARPLRRQDNKRIQIQIRRDYHKEPLNTPQPAQPISSVPVQPADCNGIINVTEAEAQSPVTVTDSPKNDDEVSSKHGTDTRENTDGSEDEQTSSEVIDSPEKMDYSLRNDAPHPVIRIPLARQAEMGNLAALRVKIQSNIDLSKLLCIKCDTHCDNIQKLYDHTAAHFNWMRYACKLCNYKHYHFDKLPEHVKVVHKLKGDKDFYFSTVKAIDGPEALELSENVEEINETDDISPSSRRPSRCSSDSSRLSDDSSSSSIRMEGGSRKRKPQQTKVYSKKRKESIPKSVEELKEETLISDKNNDIDTSSNIKSIEENSSDMDDVDDKVGKRLVIDTSSVASRRPVRKKAKPKNEDFEYDLSNLLKMEAQGYRDSQPTPTTKSYQTKKKSQNEIQLNYENANKDCCGALITLSKKAIEKSAAHMKVTNFPDYFSQKDNFSNVFVRPMVPKNISKGEKLSPKKDVEDKKDSSSPNKQKVDKEKDTSSPSKDQKNNNINEENSKNARNEEVNTVKNVNDSLNKNPTEANKSMSETTKPNLNIPSVVPIKFRRQSLEVIKNPLINKNIKDFTKAGMKTKILVIKPINRNQDGSKGSLTTPLKFQTIKLKDPNKSSTSEDKSSDQVVVVKVPKVECAIPRTVAESTNTNKEVITTTSKIESEKSDVDKQHKESDKEKIENIVCEKVKIDEPTKIDKPSESICNSDCNIFSSGLESLAVAECSSIENENTIITDKCDNHVDSTVQR